MAGQWAVIVSVALYAGLFVAAAVWTRSGKRRDAGRVSQRRGSR